MEFMETDGYTPRCYINTVWKCLTSNICLTSSLFLQMSSKHAMADSTWLQYFPYRTNLSYRKTDTCEKEKKGFILLRAKGLNQSPFFVFYKDLVQVTGVMHEHWILDLPQKTCVHFHKVLVQYKTSTYEAIKTITHRFMLKCVYFVTHWYIDEHFFNVHTRQWLSQGLHKELWVKKKMT